MPEAESRKLQSISGFLLNHPVLTDLVSNRGIPRVLAVASVRCNAKFCFLPGAPDIRPLQPPKIFYFTSGTNGRKPKENLAVQTKGQCSYVCEHYYVDASRLWSFAFSSNYTPTAAPLYQESDFLTQQAVSLKEAQLNLRKHRADWQAVPEDLSGLPLSSDPMWQAAALDKLKLKPLCNKLTAVDVKHVALGGNSRHAMDAEMQCVHCLLHDDAVKDSLMSFFEGECGPIVFDIFVNRAPCDHCCRHIIHCHPLLEARFERRVEFVISAAAPYDDQKCLGLQKISEDHKAWLTFVAMWEF